MSSGPCQKKFLESLKKTDLEGEWKEFFFFSGNFPATHFVLFKKTKVEFNWQFINSSTISSLKIPFLSLELKRHNLKLFCFDSFARKS